MMHEQIWYGAQATGLCAFYLNMKMPETNMETN